MISIIIPVFNSEKTITVLVKTIVEHIQGQHNFEILLVNDASQDNSEKICKQLVNKFSNVFLFTLTKNVGEHNAVMAGLNNCSGDYAVIMDDDLQHTPKSLLELINFALKEKDNFDVVYTYYGDKKDSFFRNIGSKANDFIANYLLDKPKHLYLSSFKIINRFLISEIVKHTSPFTYIDGIILRTTNNIGKIKVAHNERSVGESGYNLKKLLQLWSSMFTSFSILPLRLSLVIGLILSLLGFILALITFVEFFISGDVTSGYTSLFIIVTVFSGAILIALGLLGEYVGRIFLSLNKQPQYIIKNSWGNKKNLDNEK